MTQERASIFDSEEPVADFDVSGFETKKAEPKQKAVSAEAVRAVAEKAKFPSREYTPPVTVTLPAAPVTREQRRHRTGRNVQLNVKVEQKTLDTFYDIANAQGWVLGQTLEEAVLALKEKLAKAK